MLTLMGKKTQQERREAKKAKDGKVAVSVAWASLSCWQLGNHVV